MGKNKTAEVTVKFRSPSFRYNGKKYISKDVEKAAKGGDLEAEALIAHLVKIGSGVVQVVEAAEQEEAAAASKAKPKSKAKGAKTNPPAEDAGEEEGGA